MNQQHPNFILKALLVNFRQCSLIFGQISLVPRFNWINDFALRYIYKKDMASENIFIEHERWSHYSHPAAHLEQLRLINNPAAIKKYFTQRNINGNLTKQLTDAQVQKADAHIRFSKFKSIFKEKMRRLGKKGQNHFKLNLDVKMSSRTNICEDEQQEVSQYLNIWEEEVLMV